MSYSNRMIVHAVDAMESYLNNKLPETKLWEHSFIKKQINRREQQEISLLKTIFVEWFIPC